MTFEDILQAGPANLPVEDKRPNPPLSDDRQGWRGSYAVGDVPGATGLARSGLLVSHLSPYAGVSARGH